MALRLSQATSKAKKLTVEFEGGDLQVTYKPLSYTVNEMDAAREDAENTNRIIDTMKRLLVSWDLSYEDETLIPLDHPLAPDESGKLVPADDDPLRDVPTNVFTAILEQVAKDQSPSPEASRGSVAR